MQQPGVIRVSGGRRLTVDIEGVIGVPDWWAADDPAQRAATYESFRAQIERIGRSDARRIQVNIRSTGGDVNDALLIYEALSERVAEGVEVTTLCYGYAASAATLVAQAASPGRRLVSAHALYLIHQSMTTLEGNRLDAERTARMLDKTDERMAEIYASRSGRPVGMFRELMMRNGGRGEWLSAEEAVGAGLADRVSRSSSISTVRDRVAQGIRSLFRRDGAGSGEKRGEGLGGGPVSDVLANSPAESAMHLPAAVLPGADRRERVTASLTEPCEDPPIVPNGMWGEPLSRSGDFSLNGTAYERDAARLRSDY